MSAPETSILIRAFNEQKHIGDLLQAIKKQDYQDYEIVLVDSGSTDDTLLIAEEYCDKILQIQSHDFTFGYSLNVGCKNSSGKFVVMVSAHAIPTGPGWLRALVSPLKEGGDVAMVYGKHIGAQATKFSESQDFQRLFPESKEKTPNLPYYANNANSAIRKSLWDEHPFDEYLTGLEDIAWAKYFSAKGNRIVYQPEAAVHHIHEESWHKVYNRYRREALAARQIGLPQPPHASPKLRRFFQRLLKDATAAFPALSGAKLKEIARFRYYQWKGSLDGWKHDIDLAQERDDLFFSGVNQAVVISGKQKASLREVPIPDLKPGDVLVKVSHVGVCKTDLEIFSQELGYYQQGKALYPIVPGHEFCGEVVRAGANGSRFMPRDRVVGECIMPCGQCELCLAGAPASCERRQEVGVVNFNGAYSRFVALPAKYLHKVPDNLDFPTACLAEPLAVVHKGIRRLAERLPKKGAPCLVTGAGSIGNLCVQALAAEGHKVSVYDRNAARLGYLGNIAETLTHLDKVHQFSVIVEATGHVEVLQRILRESRADSTILLLGFPYGEFPFNFENVVAQDRVIVGSVGSCSEDFQWALRALPKMNMAPFVQAVFPLKDYSLAWDAHLLGSQLKVILKVSEEEQHEGSGDSSAGAVQPLSRSRPSRHTAVLRG